MIVRQAVVVAQQANPPIEIIVKRGQPVVAVLKAVVAQTVIVLQDVISVHIVMAALKGAKIKLTQLAAANHLLVISQPAAANHLLAASPPSINVLILVISQCRQSHHPIAAMVAQNAHHLPQKSASAQHGQAVMPHRRAVKAH